MKGFEALKQLEICYDTMSPAYEKSDRSFTWFSEIPHFLFNAIVHLNADRTGEAVDDLIRQVPAGNGVSFWVHPMNRAEGLVEKLKEEGFVLAITCPLMSWKTAPVAVGDVDIRPVVNWGPFVQITEVGFGFDSVVGKKYMDLLQRLDAEAYVIYCEGKPAGTGLLLPTGEWGGIFNIAVHPDFRNRGLAHDMMRFLMNRSHELGMRELVLFSSPEAAKIYRDLGFEKHFDIEIYGR
ncbi:MAG: GNAT family N-acetyltransferase [Verrucomicrobia bacterium]|nr:GNAT family N-acetyltransferase [Verrucomicrobiota bacterium]